jgi:hypothetical protein
MQSFNTSVPSNVSTPESLGCREKGSPATHLLAVERGANNWTRRIEKQRPFPSCKKSKKEVHRREKFTETQIPWSSRSSRAVETPPSRNEEWVAELNHELNENSTSWVFLQTNNAYHHRSCISPHLSELPQSILVRKSSRQLVQGL